MKHRMRLDVSTPLRAALASLALSAGAFAQTDFLRVLADSSGPYIAFGHPAVNARGDVAVLAYKTNSTCDIVRLTPYGTQVLATELNDIASLDNDSNRWLVLNDQGYVAFSALLTSGEQAVRLTDGSTTVELARNTLLPQPSNGAWSMTPAIVARPIALNNHNEVAFLASDQFTASVVFRATINGLGEVTRSSNNVTSPYQSIGSCAINDAGDVAVVVYYWPGYALSLGGGCTPLGAGLWAMVRHSPNGTATILAPELSMLTSPRHDQTRMPLLTASGAAIYDAGCDLSFNPQSITLANGAALVPLVVYDQSPQNLTTWRNVTTISCDTQGNVAFVGARGADNSLLMRGTNFPSGRVLGQNTSLAGSTVLGVDIGNDAVNDNAQIVCEAFLADGRRVIVLASPPPPIANSYCTAGVTADGCVPHISASGASMADGQGSFVVRVDALPANVNTLFFYGVSGALALPWGNSTSYLCVSSPLQRMVPLGQSGGTSAPACDGAASIDWNAYIAANPGALGVPFAYLDDVWMQLYFRDPTSPTGPPNALRTKLSDALHFNVGF